MQQYDSQWGRANVSPMVDIAATFLGYSVGLAVFNTNDIAVKIDRGIYEPRVWGEGQSNAAAVLGVAKPLSILYPGLTVGANFKFIQRRRAKLFQISASELGNYKDTTEPIIDEWNDSKHNTFAMDIGALLEIPHINTDIGASIQSIGDGRGSSLDIGIAKRMLSNRLIILADYIDLFDNNRENVFNKIHMGTELKYYFLSLRGGINSGYPAVGLGLDFNVIDIDAAYFFDELTKAPGGNEERRFISNCNLTSDKHENQGSFCCYS